LPSQKQQSIEGFGIIQLWLSVVTQVSSGTFSCADFGSPLQLSSSSVQQFVPDEGSLSMIESMGFTRQQATAALKATVRTWSHVC